VVIPLGITCSSYEFHFASSNSVGLFSYCSLFLFHSIILVGPKYYKGIILLKYLITVCNALKDLKTQRQYNIYGVILVKITLSHKQCWYL